MPHQLERVRRRLGSREQISFPLDVVSENLKPVLILGNGPGLSSDLPLLRPLAESHKIVGLNHLADTAVFREFCPTDYFIQDAYFFSPNMRPYFVERATKTLRNLEQGVYWDMTLWVPMGAGASEFCLRLSDNPRIRIAEFPVRPYHRQSELLLLRKISAPNLAIDWSIGLATPSRLNVLLTAIFWMMRIGSQDIKIVGADMSMFKDFQVDENGKLNFAFNHFYAVEVERRFSGKHLGASPSSLSHELFAQAKSFAEFDVLVPMAGIVGASIVNLSSTTMLDSIPRAALG